MKNGNLEEVRRFLDHGADVSVVDNNGKTPLHYACWRGHRDIVQLLIAYGALVIYIADDGNTYLQEAFNYD